MPKVKTRTSNTRKKVAAKKPAGIVGRIRALSGRNKMLLAIVLFAVIGTIMVMSSEAASLTRAQKNALKDLKQSHEEAEDIKKAECKSINDDKPREKACKAELKALKNSNEDEYDSAKDEFKLLNKQTAGQCLGVSTFAQAGANGADGASSTGSSSGTSGADGTGANGTSGSGASGTSGGGASGVDGTSSNGADGSDGAGNSGSGDSNSNYCQ